MRIEFSAFTVAESYAKVAYIGSLDDSSPLNSSKIIWIWENFLLLLWVGGCYIFFAAFGHLEVVLLILKFFIWCMNVNKEYIGISKSF